MGEVMSKVNTLTSNENAENVPVTTGIDLTKNMFAIHCVNRFGKPVPVCQRRLKRNASFCLSLQKFQTSFTFRAC